MDNIEKNAQNKVQEPDGKIQFGKWLLHNVIWAAILIIALVVGAKVLLGIMTRHGEQISVPDLTAMTVSEAKYNAGINGLKIYAQGKNLGMLYSSVDFMDLDTGATYFNRGFTVGVLVDF